ncbi:hypothetical protein ABXN37_29335, partial [Piscinibacter sakaiensis]
NCGCISLPRVRGWGVATPGAKPFSQLELDRNPAKAALDRAARAQGMRQDGRTGPAAKTA